MKSYKQHVIYTIQVDVSSFDVSVWQYDEHELIHNKGQLIVCKSIMIQIK